MSKTFVFKKETSVDPQHRYADCVSSFSSLRGLVVLFSAVLSLNTIAGSSDVPMAKTGTDAVHCEWKMRTNKRISIARESVRLNNRLAYILENYDEEDGGIPVGEPAIKNFKNLLSSCSDYLLAGWNLFASTNGTLSLERKIGSERNSAINIGYKDISYFISEEEIVISGKEPFSVAAINSILDKVRRI